MYRALAFLFLLSLSHSCGSLVYSLTSSQYGPITAAALGVLAASLVIAYFYAKIRNDIRLLFNVKAAVSTAFITSLFILAVEGVSLFFCASYAYITGEQISSLVEKAWNITNLYDGEYRAYISTLEKLRLSYAKDIPIRKFVSGHFLSYTSLTYPKYPEASAFYSILSAQSVSIINLLLGSIYMQKALLFFIRHFWIEGLLVSGFILRLFPPFKEAGSLLITLYVAIGHVYPFIYALAGYSFENLLGTNTLLSICKDVQTMGGLPRVDLPPPLGCHQAGGYMHYALLSLYSLWMPSVALGITLQFASAFKKALDFEVV